MQYLAKTYLREAITNAIAKANNYIACCGELAMSEKQPTTNREYFATQAEEGKEAVQQLRDFQVQAETER